MGCEMNRFLVPVLLVLACHSAYFVVVAERGDQKLWMYGTCHKAHKFMPKIADKIGQGLLDLLRGEEIELIFMEKTLEDMKNDFLLTEDVSEDIANQVPGYKILEAL